MRIRRTCRNRANWLVALVLAMLMMSLAIASASASARYHSTLSAPLVSPRETTVGHAMSFSVTYTDASGAAPKSVQVQIGDTVQAMEPASHDYRHGVRYTLSVAVPAGRHAVGYIATLANGGRDVQPAGTVRGQADDSTPKPTGEESARPSQLQPTSSPAPTSTPQPGQSGQKPNGSTEPTGGAGSTQPPASESAGPSGPTGSDGTGSPIPDPGTTAGPDAGPTETTPARPMATTMPDGASVPTGGAGDQGGGVTSGGGGAPGGQASGDQGGQVGDGSAGAAGVKGPSGHGPGLVQVVQAGSDDVNGLPSYLLVNYHEPLPQLLVTLAPTIGTATGGAAAWAAFVLFGKRRRDGGPSEAESVLATAAATGLEVGSAQGLRGVDESLIPRWRRPSLQQVRKTDPMRAVAEASHLSFAETGLQTRAGCERRQIRYRFVRLLDSPDELRSAEIGVLDCGDEVQLLERSGVHWRVLCPDGRQGWVHRMTLSDPVQVEIPEVIPYEDPAIADHMPAGAALPEPPAPEVEPAEAGFLEAYMRARSDVLRSMAAQTQVEPPAEPAIEAVGLDIPAEEPSVAVSAPVAEPLTDAAPAGEPGCAGERCSARKNAGTRKAATGSRPGTKSRRPSR